MASPARGPPLPSPMLGTQSQHPANYLEWCTAIREVKGLYFNREYKQCASRCDELLEGWKNSKTPTNHSPPHPIHATVLKFYGASALELIARPLPPRNSQKLPLLTSARDKYLAATEFLSTTIITTPEDATSAPSTPTSSTCSHTSDDEGDAASPVSSPATSAHSDEDDEDYDTSARAFAASKNKFKTPVRPKPLKVVRFSPSTYFPSTPVTETPPPLLTRATEETQAFLRKRAELRLQAHAGEMMRLIKSHLEGVETEMGRVRDAKKGLGSVVSWEREERGGRRREWIARRGWRTGELM